jgi:predicted P-loop ATPase/5S rRNA maturation endonuclease (ribonuclease M5)
MKFSIFDHVQFNKTGRAICPSCLLVKGEGYRKHNLSVSLQPVDHGAYTCHRGCTNEQIRAAVGEVKPLEKTYIPTAAPPKPIEYKTSEAIETWQAILFDEKGRSGPKALEYLLDRGLDLKTLEYFKIGLTHRKFEWGGDWRAIPCIVIPYEIEEGQWLAKYFPNKWLPESERPDQQMAQPFVTARWYFTHQPDGKELWICEGEWDALLLGQKLYNEQSDISVCTATCGAGSVPKDLSPLDKYDRIVIFYDLDEAGEKGAKKLAEAIGDRAVIATVPAPENRKQGWDITDCIKHWEKDHLWVLEEAAKDAKPLTPEIPPKVRERAIALLKKAAPSMAHDFESFCEVGRALKAISELFFDDWFEWGWRHFSRHAINKEQCFQLFEEMTPAKGEGFEELGDRINSYTPPRPTTSKSRVLGYLNKMFGKRLRLNAMSKCVELDGVEIKPDYLYLDLMAYGIESSKDFVMDVFFRISTQNEYDPLKDYLEGCYSKYGESTLNLLDNPADRYFGTDNQTYNVFVKKMLISAVARALQPGAKVDTTLILQGKQGCGKSTFFNILAGEWFEDGMGSNIADINEKMKMHAAWICEWGELERIFSQRDDSVIKSFLTSTHDNFRRPWGRTIDKNPRRSIIVASTNKDEFLTDSTGDRRYWVLEIPNKVDLTTLAKERDQLWAAAVALFKKGEIWHLTKAEEADRAASNKDFHREDPWQEAISEYLQCRERVTTSQILSFAVKMDLAHQDRAAQMRAANVLKNLGWKKIKSDGNMVWKRLEVSEVSLVSLEVANTESQDRDTFNLGIPKDKKVSLSNQGGILIEENLLEKGSIPVETQSTEAIQTFRDTGTQKTVAQGTEKYPFFAGQIVVPKSGGLAGVPLTIQSVRSKTCVVKQDGIAALIELPTKILERAK